MKPRHFAQLVGLSALWGASFLFLRIATPALTPLPLAGIRVALALVVLTIVMRALGQRWPWKHWRELLGLGTLTVVLPFLLYAWAALYLPAGYSALLNTTAVLFGTLAAAWLKEDTLTRHKLIGCALGFVGVGLIVQLGPVRLDGPTILAVLACIAASAGYGASTPLMKRATTRMEPLAIAAGLHAGAALQQAAQEGPPSPLREELRRVLGDVRTGVPRAQALRDMAERLDIPEVRAWVGTLAQADALGMSLAPLLRAQSDQRRVERFLRAERLAMEAPVKMLLPLVVCIFPCSFVAIAFPIAVKLMEPGW